MSITGPSLPIKLMSGELQRGLAESLARELDLPLEPVEIGTFADGETRVHIASDVRDASVVILQSTCPPVNDQVMTLALLADAARAAGAARIIALVPYFGYARQEQRSRNGDARSAQVVARLLGAVGIDHLVTLDLHAPALESALPMPATLLGADELFAPRIQTWHLDKLVVVAPDAGGIKRAQRVARRLEAPLALVTKERPKSDVATALDVLGDVRDRACVLVDDLASSGRTLAGAAEALIRAGALEVHAVVTHAVMAAGAWERLLSAPLKHLATTDGIPVVVRPRLEIVPIAPLLARTVRYLHGD
jgi:ribose-phosphate pyrophosphokinase